MRRETLPNAAPCAASLLWAFVLLATAAPALATSPTGGTLSLDQMELTASGGPYLVSNGGDCAAACDTYALKVDLPADYSITNPDDIVIIELSFSPQQTDLDMVLEDEDGNEVASSGNSPGQTEQIIFAPTGGETDYGVVIVPFAAGGATATLRISLVQRTVSDGAPLGSGLPPRFRNHHSPQGLGDSAGEPSIGYNLTSKVAMFIAGLETDRVTFAENNGETDVAGAALPESCDETWEDVSAPNTSVVSLDPILVTEQMVGRTFVSQLAATNSNFAFTDDDGETWLPGQLASSNASVDHQTVGSGPYPASFIGAANPDGFAVYYCAQLPEAFCSRSDNGGVNFGPAMPAFGFQECGGLHGHIRVGPDGTMYLPFKYCLGQQAVSVSTNAGLSWTVRKIPGSLGGDTDPQMAVATDGTGYFCFTNGDGRPKVAVTTDKGETWSTPLDLGASHGIKNAVFAQGIAGDPDRAACAFLGTTTPGNSGAEDFPGIWHAYIATTYDGGASWHTVNVTPGDPVQGAGGICTAGLGCGGNRNLLDFNEITIDETGRVLFGYADGCTGTCAQNPANNTFSDNGVIVRQTGGRSLKAAFDKTEPAKPARSCLADSGAGSLRTTEKATLRWQAPDTGGSAVANYKVYRGTAVGAETFLADAGDKAFFEDLATDPTVPSYFYKVTATNAEGEGLFSNTIELPVEIPPPLEDICLPPGVTVLTDATGDATGGQTAHDVQKLSISEPYFADGYKLVFQLKMAGLATVPQDTTWPVRFCSPKFTNCTDPNAAISATNKYYTVRMVSTGAGNPSPNPIFQILAPNADSVTLTTLPADAASGFSADGTITIVVKAEDIGLTTAGAGAEQLIKFLVRIRQEAGPVGAVTPDNMPDSLAGAGQFDTVPLAQCTPNAPPLAQLLANTQSGEAPLSVFFDASHSSDGDGSVASYTLDFGDGSASVTQAGNPFFLHEYAAAGTYAARLSVTDNEGAASSNTAEKIIQVGAPAEPAVTPGIENNRLGGALSGLSLMALGLAAGLGRRRKRVR